MKDKIRTIKIVHIKDECELTRKYNKLVIKILITRILNYTSVYF